MDDARALLNSLMGADRDAKPGERRVRKFTDDDVCRNFLLGLCPHDLFPNTRMDLGQCYKEHDERLKETFENDSDQARYRRRWRKGLVNALKRQLLDVDRRIGLNQSRIDRERKDGTCLPEEHKQHLASLREEVSEKLRLAEKAADDGKFEESRNIMKDTESTKRNIEDLEKKSFEKYKKDHICDVCGQIVDAEEIEAMKTGRGWHINGKQHLGFKAIRQKLLELEAETAKDRRDGIASPSPSPIKEIIKDSAVEVKRRSRSPRGTKPEGRRGRRSPSKSLARRKKTDDRKRKSSRSRSRRRQKNSPSPSRKKVEAKKRNSPSRSRGRRDRSRRRKCSRSTERRSAKTKEDSPPKRRSPSSNKDKKAKSKKSSKQEETRQDEVASAPPPLPLSSSSPPPPPPELTKVEQPPEPVKEAPPPEPEPDIDEVRPRVAFFMGFKPLK